MTEKKEPRGHATKRCSRWEIGHHQAGHHPDATGGAMAEAAGGPSLSCPEPGVEYVDGLVLCEGHALEARLEGQIACWGEMLFHVELWSREARRRDRPRVVGLLAAQRAEVMSAVERAYVDLGRARGDATGRAKTFRSWGSRGRGRPPTEGSPLLAPRPALRPSRGPRRR